MRIVEERGVVMTLCRSGLIAALTIALGAACWDDHQPAAPRRLRIGAPASAALVVDPEWDHYSSDVSVTMEGGGSVSQRAVRARRIQYHSERSLQDDGTWTSSLTF